MYGLRMSYRDIAMHVEDLYGIKVSEATISTITDNIIDEVKQWQQRPLDSHYPFLWLDAIRSKMGKQYPIDIKSWRNKWDLLPAYFSFGQSQDI